MTRVVDTFPRTAVDSWGSTPGGLPWTMWNGEAGDRSVSPGAARVTLWDSPTLIRGQYINRPWRDGEILTHMRVGQVSAGEAVTAGVLLRFGSSVYYRVRVLFEVDNTVQVGVTRGATSIGSQVDTGLTYGAGTRVRVRARVDGHRVRARVWSPSGTEPTGWQVDETIPTQSRIATGSMGTFVAAGLGNTNVDPWIEFERVELSYALLAENTLTGTSGVQVTNARLADTARSGTVTIASAGSRAVYDDTHTVHGSPMVRIFSGHHRQETPRVRVALPSSGPWCARWYSWLPSLQQAGHGDSEVRTTLLFPDRSYVVHETGTPRIGTRLYLPDLAATPLPWDQQNGDGKWLGTEILRFEAQYDGTDLRVRVFSGHTTSGEREHVWEGLPDPGRTLDLTGYRWRRDRPLLMWGDQGSAVAALQNELIDLGYDLSPWGADGDFGEGTHNIVMQFQASRGIVPVDGAAGPETRAAMDMARGLTPPPLWVSHVAVSDGEWIGPAELPPPPPVTARMGFTVGIPI